MKPIEKVIANSISTALVHVRTLSLCFLILLVAVISARALDPNKLITQYGHTAWRVQDGFLSAPNTITQTTDGYIWVGTIQGLMRFDGVKFSLWTPPEGQSLPSSGINSLHGARDGSLWIGSTGGLARLKDGQLLNYAPQTGHSGINRIMEDETGTIWFTRYRVNDGKGPLCRITGEDLRCYGTADGIPPDAAYASGLKKDAAGNIWLGSAMLCRWSPGSPASVYFEKELKHTGGDGVIDVAVSASGSIWAALDGIGPDLGVRHYSEGKWSGYVVPGFDGTKVRSHVLFIDRNNSLWVGTESQGLYHIHDGTADHYGMANGLSGISVSSIYEDREGNIWVATDSGVDMFRDTPVVSFTSNEGLSGADIDSIIALRNGTLLVGNQQAVDVIRPGSRHSAITTLKGLPGEDLMAMLEERSGRIWLGVDDRLVTYENGRFGEAKKSDGSPLGHIGLTMSLTEDVDGNVWALVLSTEGRRRLLRIKDQVVQEDLPVDDAMRRGLYLAADRQSGFWMASLAEKLARYRDGRMEVFSLWQGEGLFITHTLFVDSENAVWVSTNRGLYRRTDETLNVLDSRNGLPCSVIYSAIEDNQGALWLYAQCGILKIPAQDIATWRESPESKVSVEILDLLDGAFPGAGSIISPRVAKSPDGRLWFVNGKIVQTIDPSRFETNPLSPPVHLEELIADRKSYRTHGQIVLPPLRGELEINYTALCLTVPQKVRFRYKLEGYESEWHDVGTRRQAFYNDLGPGQYRFRVIASNNDGVWNETGATLDFTIEPRWYQTAAFRVLSLFLLGIIAWALYRLRIRQISNVITARFDERLAERTRLARELHDTLLQTIQGSKLVADDALEQPGNSVHMRRALEQLSAWLGQATEEGRNALSLLRTSTTETNDLAGAFRRAAEGCQLRETAEVTFSVVGDAKEMHPIVRDEVYRIGYEAIRNACQHSGATRLEVELSYAHDLSVRVKDNGSGIEPVVAAEGRQGHFGLQGMRERAARIGAKLTIVSSANSGTEITLVVPGAIVFRKASKPALEP